MQLVFDPHDRPFVDRLSADLERRGIAIVLRERQDPDPPPTGGSEERPIVVISRSALDWSTDVVERALPIVIEQLDLPEQIAGIKYADFAASYESGLDQLLRSVSPAQSRLLFESGARQFACAFQGQRKEKPPPQFGMVALTGDKWTFAAVIESVGDRVLAPRLTDHLCQMLAQALEKLGVPGRDCLEALLALANLFARAFRIDMKLPLDFPLGATIAAMAQFEDQTLAATLGESGVFTKSWRNDREIELVSYYSRHKRLPVPAIDSANTVVASRAPLGFLDFGKDDRDWAECREVPFVKRGDLVALANFRFPNASEELKRVGMALARSHDAESSARHLVNAFAAPGLDAICGVACQDPAQGSEAHGKSVYQS